MFPINVVSPDCDFVFRISVVFPDSDLVFVLMLSLLIVILCSY